jgi:hypothetical protein
MQLSLEQYLFQIRLANKWKSAKDALATLY